ncbi:MAG: FAD-binding and (Fe-S)-binding domain-containing protein [Planctomycetota bacterium]
MTSTELPQFQPPRQPASDDPAGRRRIAADLEGLIEGQVRFGRHDRMLYATDASLYQVEPIGVVVPMHRADVEAVVRYCAAHDISLLSRGGGTSLAGQTVNESVVIDFSANVNALVGVDVKARTARVEPGMVLDHLNEALQEHDLLFGPDVATASHATIGGMIGNNSAGARSVRYGRTVENVEALEVLLGDGQALRLAKGAAEGDERVSALTKRLADIVAPIADAVRDRFPRITRHVDGYNLDLLLQQIEASTPGTFDEVNLAHLVCGSEGTLAITTEATLRLVPRPRHTGLAIVAYADVDSALQAVGAILETSPSAVELIDDVVIGLAADSPSCARAVDVLPRGANGARPGAVLYIEQTGDSPEGVRAALERSADASGGWAVEHHLDPASVQRAWALRKAGEPLLHGRPGRRKPVTFIEDLAVDPAVLPEFVDRFREILERHGTEAAYYAHASVGCLHIRPFVDPVDPADRRVMLAIAEEATDLVRHMGGALSGEHGDGRLRSHLLERFYGPEICNAFAAVKDAFDPARRLNPGVIVDPRPMHEHLRVAPGEDEQVLPFPEVETYYRYDREHGFAEAAQRCNGAGVCRRTSGGTMCPSYRATRDERHSTRGRGNALRLAISGQLRCAGTGPDWHDEETLGTLDLCLSCKACAGECPSNVDVGRLKAEYLAQGYRAAGGAPWRSRLLAEVRTLNAIGSACPPLSGVVGATPLRGLVDPILNVDRRRSLPSFGWPLPLWHRLRRRPAGAGPCVVYLPDCFTLYNEPAIGRAAIRLLERLGYRVLLPQMPCCGRPHMSLGLLDRAIDRAERGGRVLDRLIAEHDPVAIIGAEPSCVSAVTSDWTDLHLGIEPARITAIAERTMRLETFIESRWEDHPVRPSVDRRGGPPVLLHGHCHEKALWGMSETVSLLERIVGDRLTLLDSGCCGMAGAFGASPERYDLSMQIGELSLFPPIRAAADAIVLAAGTSCRHQIKDATARRAMHPIELIAGSL